MKYCQALKKILIELRLNQTELAAELGVSRQQLSHMITGKNSLTQKTMEILHDKFNVNLNWLLYGEGSMFIKKKKKSTEVVKIRLKKGQRLEVEYEE